MRLVALVIVCILLAACKDLTSIDASYVNVSDTATVYALNGAPAGAPSGLYVYSGSVLAADANFLFDIAFDIAGPGQVTILPLRAVATGLVSTHSVGLAIASDTFTNVTSVPKGTSFRADTAITIDRNQVVLIQVDESASGCASSYTGYYLYAKLVVRSIDQATRSMFIEFTTNPNCGFRSFQSGVPDFLRAPERRLLESSLAPRRAIVPFQPTVVAHT